MPEDLKLSQIGSSPLPPPFRGLHSPEVRKLSNYLCLLFPEIVYWADVTGVDVTQDSKWLKLADVTQMSIWHKRASVTQVSRCDRSECDPSEQMSPKCADTTQMSSCDMMLPKRADVSRFDPNGLKLMSWCDPSEHIRPKWVAVTQVSSRRPCEQMWPKWGTAYTHFVACFAVRYFLHKERVYPKTGDFSTGTIILEREAVRKSTHAVISRIVWAGFHFPKFCHFRHGRLQTMILVTVSKLDFNVVSGNQGCLMPLPCLESPLHPHTPQPTPTPLNLLLLLQSFSFFSFFFL